MPTYEFACPRGHDFEKFYSKISDAVSELPCPECGEKAVRQISGGAGLLFKGSGFYLTDYGKNAHRGDAKKPAAGGESKSSESTPSESKSSESKPSESKSSESKPSESKGGESSGSAAPGKPAGGAAASKPPASKSDAPKPKGE